MSQPVPQVPTSTLYQTKKHLHVFERGCLSFFISHCATLTNLLLERPHQLLRLEAFTFEMFLPGTLFLQLSI